MTLSGRNTSALEEVTKACQEAGLPQDKVMLLLVFLFLFFSKLFSSLVSYTGCDTITQSAFCILLKDVNPKNCLMLCQVLSVAADLCKDEDCERVVSATVSHFGRLDVLVNSAGESLSILKGIYEEL